MSVPISGSHSVEPLLEVPSIGGETHYRESDLRVGAATAVFNGEYFPLEAGVYAVAACGACVACEDGVVSAAETEG